MPLKHPSSLPASDQSRALQIAVAGAVAFAFLLPNGPTHWHRFYREVQSYRTMLSSIFPPPELKRDGGKQKTLETRNSKTGSTWETPELFELSKKSSGDSGPQIP